MIAVFDFDDTLVSRTAAVRRWAELLVQQEDLGADAVAAIVAADCGGAVPREAFLTAVRALAGMRMTATELHEWYAASYPQCYGVEDDSIRALTLLRDAGWKIGVVTNGSSTRTATKVIRAGLTPLIDALCIAEEVGVAKPDQRIFEEVARRCGVALDGWMIGDAPLEDVVGGARAGLRTAWLRRGRQWDARTPPPDIEAESALAAVRAILASPGAVAARSV